MKRFMGSIADLPFSHIVKYAWMPSSLKRFVYSLKGYRIHPTARIGIGSVIVGDVVDIGPEVKIGPASIICGRRVSLGARVRIGALSAIQSPIIEVGEGTRIGSQVIVGGLQTPRSVFKMGRNCILMEWSFINTSMEVVIGDEVGIGGHCLFFTHGLWPSAFDGFPVNFGPIYIEDQAWLAWRVSVLPNVTVGRQSIISTDACVNKSIPARSLAGGVPARVIREDGDFIQERSGAQNWELLLRLMDEYADWVSFQGGKVSRREAGVFSFFSPNGQGDCIVMQAIGSNLELALSLTGNERLLICLEHISREDRDKLEKKGWSWFDISSRERSVLGAAFTDHVEEFLRRAGLRMLKYGRWNAGS